MANRTSSPIKPRKGKPSLTLRDLYFHPAAQFFPTTAFERKLAQEAVHASGLPGAPTSSFSVHGNIVRGSEFKRSRSHYEAQRVGQAAMWSMVHSYGDFLENAAASYRTLRSVKSLIDTSREHADLGEVLERRLSEPGDTIVSIIAPLARFDTLKKFALKGEKPKGFEPLRTNENRDKPYLWRPGARKRITDPFTAEVRQAAVTTRIQGFLADTSIAGAQLIMPHALLDQQMRVQLYAAELRKAPDQQLRAANAIIGSCRIEDIIQLQ